MDSYQLALSNAGDEIETEIISSDDMAKMLEVDNQNLSEISLLSELSTSVPTAVEEVFEREPTPTSLALDSPFLLPPPPSSITLSIPTCLLQSNNNAKEPTVPVAAKARQPPRKILPSYLCNAALPRASNVLELAHKDLPAFLAKPSLTISDFLKSYPFVSPVPSSASSVVVEIPAQNVTPITVSPSLQSCLMVSDPLLTSVTSQSVQNPVNPRDGAFGLANTFRTNGNIRISFVTKIPGKLPIPLNPAKTEFRYSITAPLRKPFDDGLLSGSTSSSKSVDVTRKSSDKKPTGRKPCRCEKSLCLKLYCDCFNYGEICGEECSCKECYNNSAHKEERSEAVRSILARNPLAFKPKITHAEKSEVPIRSHVKGCQCKKSACRKNYCECFLAKAVCGDLCKCVDCQNVPPEKLLQKLPSSKDKEKQSESDGVAISSIEIEPHREVPSNMSTFSDGALREASNFPPRESSKEIPMMKTDKHRIVTVDSESSSIRKGTRQLPPRAASKRIKLS